MTKITNYWLAISAIPHIGATLGTYLYSNNLDPRDFWEADRKKLKTAYSSSDGLCEKIIAARKGIKPEQIAAKLREQDVNWTTIDCHDFPEGLKNIPGPPTAIYFKGTLGVLGRCCVAVVGSRRPSVYGRQVTENLSRALTRAGIVIVSGLAMGIDAIAHETALNYGPTVAVLGCGIDIAYPARNRFIYKKIPDEGCIISEYPPGTDPMPFRFPARNRIISGLSELVIVTEANYKSGALLTADYALDQGKDVLAVPGNIYSPLSKGPHKLLKNGAIMVEHPDDVLELLHLNTAPANQVGMSEQTILLSDEESNILKSVPFVPMHIDRLIAQKKLPAEKITAILSILEIKGFVSQDAGKRYQRTK